MDTLNEVLPKMQRDGRDARLTVRDETPLIWAVSEGYPDIALALIEAGADLDARNKDGNTALLRSACEGRPALTRALIEAGADLDAQNNDGYSALILAKRRGNLDVVALLREAGADPCLTTRDGATVDDAGDSPKVSLRGRRDAALEARILTAIRGA